MNINKGYVFKNKTAFVDWNFKCHRFWNFWRLLVFTVR